MLVLLEKSSRSRHAGGLSAGAMAPRGQASCGAYGVDGAVRGSMIGFMWGLFSSSIYGWQDGVRGKMLAAHVGRNLAANSAGFALFLGL